MYKKALVYFFNLDNGRKRKEKKKKKEKKNIPWHVMKTSRTINYSRRTIYDGRKFLQRILLINLAIRMTYLSLLLPDGSCSSGMQGPHSQTLRRLTTNVSAP